LRRALEADALGAGQSIPRICCERGEARSWPRRKATKLGVRSMTERSRAIDRALANYGQVAIRRPMRRPIRQPRCGASCIAGTRHWPPGFSAGGRRLACWARRPCLSDLPCCRSVCGQFRPGPTRRLRQRARAWAPQASWPRAFRPAKAFSAGEWAKQLRLALSPVSFTTCTGRRMDEAVAAGVYLPLGTRARAWSSWGFHPRQLGSPSWPPPTSVSYADAGAVLRLLTMIPTGFTAP